MNKLYKLQEVNKNLLKLILLSTMKDKMEQKID